MRKTERTIVPGSNRHLMQLAMEQTSPPPLTLVQRVSQLELFLSKLGSPDELKHRIKNLEDKMFNSNNSKGNGIGI